MLQNIDAVKKTFTGSKYGYLYESLVMSSLSKISASYSTAGSYDIDIGILSELSFDMLRRKKTSFSNEQMENVVLSIGNRHLIQVSSSAFIQRMVAARIISVDSSSGDTYRFMYPYIFYYFCGRYIAYHISESVVQEVVEYMSARLYNEVFGNIIIFVCHFANNSDIIDDVLINAYDTLEEYDTFDFTKKNPTLEEIKDAIEVFIPKTVASSDEDVLTNKETQLEKMDEVGINDGTIIRSEDTIDDDVSEQEKDLTAVVAALKTIDVLGEILQNYPVGIDGTKKIEIMLNTSLKPFLLGLVRNGYYTQYELKNVLDLHSIYAVRIFELIQEKIKLPGKKPLPMDGVRVRIEKQTILDACMLYQVDGKDRIIYDEETKKPKEKYPKLSRFKEIVIKKACEEISANTDYYVPYSSADPEKCVKFEKKGRDVVAFNFYVNTHSHEPDFIDRIWEARATG